VSKGHYTRLAVEAQLTGAAVVIRGLIADAADRMNALGSRAVTKSGEDSDEIHVSNESLYMAFGQHGTQFVSWHWRATFEPRGSLMPKKTKGESDLIVHLRRQKRLTADGETPLEALDELVDKFREWVRISRDEAP
jgi:hypothetical protein